MLYSIESRFLKPKKGSVRSAQNARAREREKVFDVEVSDIYRYKVSKVAQENVIRWDHTFSNSYQGQDMFPLVDRPRPEGILPALIGQSNRGEQYRLDFARRHTLICGSTTWGKSNLLRQLFVQLMHFNHPRYLRIIACDAKNVGFTAASKVMQVAGGFQATSCQLIALGEELARRRALFAQRKWSNLLEVMKKGSLVRDKAIPPFIFCVVDEYETFIAKTRKSEEGKQAEQAIYETAAQGASLGISLVLASQQPLKEFVNTTIRANFETRIFFHMAEYQHWQMLGRKLGDLTSFMIPGEFLMRYEKGIVRGRTTLCEDYVFQRACENIKANGKDFRVEL